eukprot:CAMPEP_0117438202 /NCGR_PEP_ID=MMETSP0759-20121206/1931_1 /TAXON_ID=63605 /ORGANISM="Percolomonas cosmopolitus, Strain WS" /LENGTH=932 /DNA_ID=CAMNT_0005229885 /DNA_START=190 /DNA_END=2985 /DNA_ORIENTATION=-
MGNAETTDEHQNGNNVSGSTERHSLNDVEDSVDLDDWDHISEKGREMNEPVDDSLPTEQGNEQMQQPCRHSSISPQNSSIGNVSSPLGVVNRQSPSIVHTPSPPPYALGVYGSNGLQSHLTAQRSNRHPPPNTSSSDTASAVSSISRKRNSSSLSYSDTPPTKHIKFSPVDEDSSQQSSPPIVGKAVPSSSHSTCNHLPPFVRQRFTERDRIQKNSLSKRKMPRQRHSTPQNVNIVNNIVKVSDNKVSVSMSNNSQGISRNQHGRSAPVITNIHVHFNPMVPRSVPAPELQSQRAPIRLTHASKIDVSQRSGDAPAVQRRSSPVIARISPQHGNPHIAAHQTTHHPQGQISNSFEEYRKSDEKLFVHAAMRPTESRILSITTKRIIADQTKPPSYNMSPEQDFIVHKVVMHNMSLFCTGSAGTGKSVLLRKIVEDLRAKHGQDSVFVTAPTGIAAINIEGVTLHRFLGIQRGGTECKETMFEHAYGKKHIRHRLLQAKCIVLDEVSMVDASLLDKIEFVIRQVRSTYAEQHPRMYDVDSCKKLFGGVQMVIFGDFFQLPPVPTHKTKEVNFAFEADCWDPLFDKHTFLLKTVWRQSDDKFIQILNELRLGHVTETTINLLRSRIGAYIECTNGVLPTTLFSRREEVYNENKKHLDSLPGQKVEYKSIDGGDTFLQQVLNKNCAASREITLKRHAQVMLIKNMDFHLGLVNGTKGVVIGFDEETKFPIVRFEAAHHRIVEKIVEPLDFFVSLGSASAWRQQLPLSLAWAITIHKSQGLTLSTVKVALGSIFESGQAYVALSRCQSLDGLSLIGDFLPSKIIAHPVVLEWHKKYEQQNRIDSYDSSGHEAEVEESSTVAGTRKSMTKTLTPSIATRRGRQATVDEKGSHFVEISNVESSDDEQVEDDEIDFEDDIYGHEVRQKSTSPSSSSWND